MALYEHLPAAASTMWADACTAASASLDYKGMAPTRKTVAGKVYWYAQGKNPDGTRSQQYIGPESDQSVKQEVQRLLLLKQLHQRTRELSNACVSLGAHGTTPQHSRILRAIAGSGFFEAGGVLGGTHAFLAYQNLLGVRWSTAATTMDVDFVAPARSVLLQKNASAVVQAYQAIAALGMGFVERPAQGGFAKADEPEFVIDMLTTISRDLPAGSDPGPAAGFDGRYLPLKFMELAFRSPLDTFTISGAGMIKIRVPAPADFAVHKLIVAEERRAKQPLKSRKDLAQAACLISALEEIDPDSLEDSFQDALSRGKGWRTRILLSAERVQSFHPEIACCLEKLLEDPEQPMPDQPRE